MLLSPAEWYRVLGSGLPNSSGTFSLAPLFHVVLKYAAELVPDLALLSSV